MPPSLGGGDELREWEGGENLWLVSPVGIEVEKKRSFSSGVWCLWESVERGEKREEREQGWSWDVRKKVAFGVGWAAESQSYRGFCVGSLPFPSLSTLDGEKEEMEWEGGGCYCGDQEGGEAVES
jgi:hypothetical protein